MAKMDSTLRNTDTVWQRDTTQNGSPKVVKFCSILKKYRSSAAESQMTMSDPVLLFMTEENTFRQN